MLSWFKFVEKYAQEKNILYDTALDSSECIKAYKIQQEEYREKHRARVVAMSSNVQRNMNEMRKEMHRMRVLAMKDKVAQLVQESPSAPDSHTPQLEISEQLEKKGPKESFQNINNCGPIGYSRPIPPMPPNRPHSTPKRKVAMFFTPTITK